MTLIHNGVRNCNSSVVSYLNDGYVKLVDKDNHIIHFCDNSWECLLKTKDYIDSYINVLRKWTFPFEQVVQKCLIVLKEKTLTNLYESINEMLTFDSIFCNEEINNYYSEYFFWKLKLIC